MSTYNTDEILERVEDALEHSDIAAAIRLLQVLRAPDQADVFEDLNDEDQLSLLPHLTPSISADILEDMEDAQAAELVSALSPENAIRILDEMEPDEAADLLGDIQSDQAQSLLAQLENPEEIRPLLLHADESAGGIMTSEFLALRRRMTAAEAIQALRQWKPEAETAYYLFVVDGTGKLCGVVSLRQLVVTDPQTRLSEIMDPEVISVQAGADQEECANLMQRYDLLALPVVDETNKLMGVITVDDVMDVLADEATEDIQRLGGTEPLTEPYLRTDVISIMRKRIGWLFLLFITGSLTGTVLRHFEKDLLAVVELSFFIPLLIGTGGNAGSQTTSTIIRSLALGEIEFDDAIKALWHELRVGLALGLGMGIIAYIRAITWGVSPELAITVSLAILAIVIWANSMGAILPILASRLKIDPTVVSGPVMSTLVDATGLLLYFYIARLVMGF